MKVIAIGNGQLNQMSMQEISNSLDCMHDKQAVLILNSSGDGIATTLDASYYKGAGLRNGIEREFIAMQTEETNMRCNYDGTQVSPTLTERNAGGAQRMPDKQNFNAVIDESPGRKYVIRRLTPLECCRLQGFPDYWENGVEGSDSARYKMWGNGMALPCVVYVMQGIKDVLEGK